MDGNVIIKAVLDTVDVSKNIKALERDLQGISWKNITEGDEKAAKLSSSFKKAGTAATVTLTACMDTLLTRYLASLPSCRRG